MKLRFLLAMSASAFVVASPLAAQSQLARSAGLTEAEAAGMTLNEIAAAKHNRGMSVQDEQIVMSQQTPGSNPDLEALAMEKYNRDQSSSDRLVYGDREASTALAFQDTVDPVRHAQLIAAAGLTQDEAAGMSVGEVASLYLDSTH